MGAEQSSSRDGGQENAPRKKRDYYEVLGVGRLATDDEIKKAYRKKALELHPDRNYGDIDNATAKFAEVSSAYEVLSDPQERSWYDSHRDSILRGDTGGTEEDYEHNLHLTSAHDIVNLMSKFNARVPFTDAPMGFYGILREVFENLAKEEDVACEWEGIEPTEYPEFGGAKDTYEDLVRPFYRVWINFSTKKTFSWKDAYRTSDAPDRATRRLIEKENRRFRDEGIREFNDAVRALVAFVRKRDPRYVPNSQTEADRQKILRDAAAAQAARSRAANQARLNEHVVADWAKTTMPEEEAQFSESSESEIEEIECVVCGKTFKSEKQYETHEKSKKHQKAVQQLQREMRKENKRLNLDDDASDSSPTTLVEDLEKLDLQLGDAQAVGGNATTEDHHGFEENETSTLIDENEDHKSAEEDTLDSASQEHTRSPPDTSDVDDEYGPREDLEKRLGGSFLLPNNSNSTSTSTVGDSGDLPIQKLGKAKAKRVKKAARQEMEASASQESKCAACNQSFPSKTKLFNHIKELDHAQPVPKAPKGKNKRK